VEVLDRDESFIILPLMAASSNSSLGDPAGFFGSVEGCSLCIGYDSAKKAPKHATLLDASDIAPGGTNHTCTIEVCVNSTEVAQTLRIDSSASADGFYGGVKAKMDLMQEMEISTYSTTVVVYANTQNGPQTIRNAVLKPDVTLPDWSTATSEVLNEFVRVYGDSFVSSVTEGGEFYALYTFKSASKESQQSLKADLEAKVQSGLSSGSFEFQTEMDEVASAHSVEYKADMKLSGFKNLGLPSPNDLVSFAQNFTMLVPDSPVVTSIESTPYEQVPGFGSFANIPQNRLKLIGGWNDKGLIRTFLDLTSLSNSIQSLKNLYRFYGPDQVYVDQTLDSKEQAVHHDLDLLRNTLEQFANTPSAPIEIDPMTSLSDGSPVLSIDVHLSNNCGGQGGSRSEMLSDMGYTDLTSALLQHHRIKQVGFRTGQIVDYLEVTYLNDRFHKTIGYGGGGGGSGTTLTLEESQYICQVDANSGTVLDRLILWVGAAQYGGGGGGGSRTSLSFGASSSYLAGFNIQHSTLVDSIQFIGFSFKPAVWSGLSE
jgi:hypothetical protein